MSEQTTQIVREAPEIEAYKLGLLQSAQALSRTGRPLPPQLIAALSGLQTRATQLAQAGIGGYTPYLTEAGYTLGDAESAINAAMTGATPLRNEAAGAYRTALQGIPAQVRAAQTGISGGIGTGAASLVQATTGMGLAAQGARNQAVAGRTDMGAAAGRIPGVLSGTEADIGRALSAAEAAAQRAGQTGVVDTLGAGLGASTAAGRQATQLAGQRARAAAQEAGAGGLGAFQQAGMETQAAITGARGITGRAAQALQQAGALGTGAAQQGIAGLAGTTGAFDPTATGAFMNQYEDAAVQQALRDIQRAGDIQQQQVAAQAVGSGAFGGSRQAVQEAEVQRNILEQQGRTAAGMRQQGFESAAQRAQQAFEAQQARSQQAAQLTGSLGAQGAQAGLQAAQAAGELGLSAEELAARTAQQQGQLGLSAYGQMGQQAQAAEQLAGQLGLSAEQLASANAQALASTGMNLQQLAAQTGMSSAQLAGQLGTNLGQLGLQGAGQQADIARQAAMMGISAEQLAGQLASQAGQLGQAQGQLAVQGSQASGALGLQGQELTGRLGEGLGALGTQYGQLGMQQGEALSQLGLRQGALGELSQQLGQQEQGFLFDMGRQLQAQQQAELEATRQNALQRINEPYERLAFLSDIYKGAPSSQMAISQTSGGGVSPAQSILGLGVAGLAAASGANRAGLFG